MEVEYITHNGDDLLVVNAARVSFNKRKEVFDEGDAKLINYLAKHSHWTPFSHPQITLKIKAPIFVARQLFKHKVGLTENEVSRRYVDDEPEFYKPDAWRGKPVNAKQGSDGAVTDQNICYIYMKNLYAEAWGAYAGLLREGVAPEQARMVLPQSMYTEWFWTGSLASFARVCKLRLDPHAQQETRVIAEKISEIVEPLFPVSWRVLVD
jgi:thymidylate synthase (FAD)